jgi:hypothetical protein
MPQTVFRVSAGTSTQLEFRPFEIVIQDENQRVLGRGDTDANSGSSPGFPLISV